MQEHQSDDIRDQRIREVLEDELQRRATGDATNVDLLIDQHRDLMPALTERLRVLCMVEEAQRLAEGRDRWRCCERHKSGRDRACALVGI